MAIWSRPRTDPVDGRLIAGRYRLAEQLGSGGMGAVWAGHDTLVDREVALKEAHFPAHLAADGKARATRVARILREARAAARIDHPAVVRIHDVVMHDGRPWIVMERVYGESLAEQLRRQVRLSEEEAARIAGPVAQALGAAHARGVLHRDVKPANVLLGPGGRVVLTDFGIAHIEGEDSLTRSGEFVGSIEYTAPERMGGLKPGPPADLWSFGVMLFQMTEGWSPFRRPTVEGTITAVLTTKAPRPVHATALATLITALLERDPADRPTAGDAAKTLLALAHPLPVPQEAGGAAPHARPARITGSGAPPPDSLSGGGASPRRRRLVVGAIAAVAGGAGLTPFAVKELHGNGRPGATAKPTPTAAAGRRSPSPTSTPRPPTPPAAAGYVRVTEKPFTIEIPDGWRRQTPGTAEKFTFAQGTYHMVVAAGPELIESYGGDPLEYQVEEPELAAFRGASWSSAEGLEQARISGRAGARGIYAWRDSKGLGLYARNTVLIVGTRFHVIFVMGPDNKTGRDLVSRVARHASQTYTPVE